MDSAGRWLALRFTERHYAPWTRSRQQIEADLKAAWSNDPVIREVHGGYTRNGPLEVYCFQEEGLVGAVGIEPTTFGLKGRCSTTELRP